MESEHDTKVAGHFGRERTIELLTRNCYWPNMDLDIHKNYNQCNNCQQTKASRQAKHGILHPVEIACKP